MMEDEQLVGQSPGRYQLVSLLGEGKMGVVFRARDGLHLDAVACKMYVPGSDGSLYRLG